MMGLLFLLLVMTMLLTTYRPSSCQGAHMILDTDIHNFYEHLVLKEIEKQGLNQKLNSEQMADLCCLTLNQLPSHYIRHDVDMIYFLTDAKRTEMENNVIASLKQAREKVKNAPPAQS
ncbi:hypothetical protein FRN27_05655 [Aeromonas salmonicida]|nr:hypothetical protein CE456_04445 [Aeromonas salmonicida]AYO61815.1 hypothetical protein C5P03_02445 [Aeromonas salmonicida subsp. salmonicida 01-B526]QEO85402.1 hypothetical protein E3D14_19695 [Aeromonas salmonicida subsp. salmonicida]ASI26336.1 hypothetical protein CE463_04475 [Aeromonas salmonicida]ASI30455.1 hypothetical protein CE462_03370 [Aeromonas salmonicida]